VLRSSLCAASVVNGVHNGDMSNDQQNPPDETGSHDQPGQNDAPSAGPPSGPPDGPAPPNQPPPNPPGWEDTTWDAQSRQQQPGSPYTQPQPGPAPAQPGWNTPPQGAQVGGWGPYGQPADPQPSGSRGNKLVAAVRTFVKDLFNLEFDRFVTPSILKVLYLLTIIGVGLYWFGSVIFLFAAGATTSGAGNGGGAIVFLAVLDLLFGWIFALVFLALFRVQYEYMVAMIRTSEYARDINAKLTHHNK